MFHELARKLPLAVVRRLQNLRRHLIGPPGEQDEREVVDGTVTAAA
jgi:hypothetical protein